MLGNKDNHNIHGRFNVLAGLGRTKLRRLIGAGIYSMHEMLAALTDDDNVVEAGLEDLLCGWQAKVLMYYNELDVELKKQTARLEEAEECLALVTVDFDEYTAN